MQGAAMDFYETLGVARSAEPQVIDAAYKAMMRRYHPDVFDGPREVAEKRSKALNEAYAVLRNPLARATYDRKLDSQAEAGRPKESQEQPKPKPEPTNVEPEPAAEPWQWGTDPLGKRNVKPPKPKHLLLKAGAGVAAFAIIAAIISNSNRDQVKALPPPRATPTPSEVANAPSPNSTATETPPAPVNADCKGPNCRVLTPFGWGGIEAGVSTDSAELASGMQIKDDGYYTGPACLSYEVVGGPTNLAMLVEQGTITTVSVRYDPKLSNFSTDRGVKLGDPEWAVRAAYKDLKQLPDIYSEPPDKKLFHYEPGGERGIKFSIVKGKVEMISVGTTSIEYVEGCL
jgi:hypothetical protein